MNGEIRVYYESYEQANHFIKPIIEKHFPRHHFKLIYLSKSKSYVKDSLIYQILRFKNPDILISYVNENSEIPIFVIEFSEAVTTEDHELQRFDGYLGAVAGRCFYVKISPIKKSQSAHGGNTKFDTFEPYALIFKRFGVTSFHFLWPLDGTYTSRHVDYFSCPFGVQDFDFLLIQAIDYVISNFKNVLSDGFLKVVTKQIQSNENLKLWIEKLNHYDLDDDCTAYDSSRLMWEKNEKCLLFKFNRMGHAMDPERGMIWYYKYRYNQTIISRIVFPSTGDEIFKKINLKTDYDYLQAFIDGTRLDKNGSFEKFLLDNRYVQDGKLLTTEIDITDFLKENIDELNKQLFAIFFNSKKFLIQDKDENTKIVFLSKYEADIFNLETNMKPSKIEEKFFLSEDDVTYIVVHQVLKPNGFKIISLSYPGAQGDRAVLPEAGTGRKQKRKYIDIIAYHPGKCFDLTENKGEYSLSETNKDIGKLNQYKLDNSFKSALYRLAENMGVKEEKKLPILLSIGFWLSSEKSDLKKLDISKIDFFIIISADMKTWKVWVGGDLNILKIRQGAVSMEKTYSLC